MLKQNAEPENQIILHTIQLSIDYKVLQYNSPRSQGLIIHSTIPSVEPYKDELDKAVETFNLPTT